MQGSGVSIVNIMEGNYLNITALNYVGMLDSFLAPI